MARWEFALNTHPKPRIAILNAMAHADFGQSLDFQKSWGIEDLDLKDSIFGKSIIDLTDNEAQHVAAMVQMRGLRTYCLSTGLFHDDPLKGAAAFKADNLAKIPRIIEIAKILTPRFIRLLPAKVIDRRNIIDSIAWARTNFGWLFDHYQQAIASVHAAGFEATIENEVYGCLFGNPEEVLAFYDFLGRACPASFTWDIQNMWQSGCYPSLDTYRRLKGLIKYVHVKGGIQNAKTRELEWASVLEDATWPVLDIMREVIRDGVSPVICINPSHGKRAADFDALAATRQDIVFVSTIVTRGRS